MADDRLMKAEEQLRLQLEDQGAEVEKMLVVPKGPDTAIAYVEIRGEKAEHQTAIDLSQVG